MARTLNGNYTGRAASIERHEIMQAIRENSFERRWQVALWQLQDLDPEGWAAWYDAQSVKTCGEMLPLIEERISLIHSSMVTGDVDELKRVSRTCHQQIKPAAGYNPDHVDIPVRSDSQFAEIKRKIDPLDVAMIVTFMVVLLVAHLYL